MSQENKYTLSASILAADFSNLSENIKNLKEFGCNEIHFDVMDGKFVDEISMGPVVLESIIKDINLPIDVHLMVDNPKKYRTILKTKCTNNHFSLRSYF